MLDVAKEHKTRKLERLPGQNLRRYSPAAELLLVVNQGQLCEWRCTWVDRKL